MQDAPESLASMLEQIWEAVRCISKSVFALEQKVSIINFDMELMRENLKKTCDLMSLHEPPVYRSMVNTSVTPTEPVVSRTAILDLAGNVTCTPVGREPNPMPVSASTGSKSVSMYDTPQSRRFATPSREEVWNALDVTLDHRRDIHTSRQPEWETQYSVLNCASPGREAPPPTKIPRVLIEPPLPNRDATESHTIMPQPTHDVVLGEWSSRLSGNGPPPIYDSTSRTHVGRTTGSEHGAPFQLPSTCRDIPRPVPRSISFHSEGRFDGALNLNIPPQHILPAPAERSEMRTLGVGQLAIVPHGGASQLQPRVNNQIGKENMPRRASRPCIGKLPQVHPRYHTEVRNECELHSRVTNIMGKILLYL